MGEDRDFTDTHVMLGPLNMGALLDLLSVPSSRWLVGPGVAGRPTSMRFSSGESSAPLLAPLTAAISSSGHPGIKSESSPSVQSSSRDSSLPFAHVKKKRPPFFFLWWSSILYLYLVFVRVMIVSWWNTGIVQPHALSLPSQSLGFLWKCPPLTGMSVFSFPKSSCMKK